MKLMIVDDEKLLRNGFRHMTDWASKGIEIISEAMNGEDALEKLQHVEPDVVLTDINMPVMNGIELTKRIKTLYPHIIVVILSGYDNYDYIRDSMKNGANDYLLKASIDVDDIYEMLQKLHIEEKNNFLSSANSPGEETPMVFDDQKIINFIELKQFQYLTDYVINVLRENEECPISSLQDILRDLLFFIQFHLDRLNALSTYLKRRKYLHSSSVNMITDMASAIDWVSLVLSEITKNCESGASQHKTKVNEIIAIITDDYANPDLTLSFIAEKLFLNKNYLCDIFKAETGATINQYIATTRINAAKELIRQGQWSLTMISEQVGYKDYNYFSRVFRKKLGISPREYGKMYDKKSGFATF